MGCPPYHRRILHALYSVARGRDTKETKMFQDVRLAGVQESLPQQAEVTIGLLPACFPGKVAQWHRCLCSSPICSGPGTRLVARAIQPQKLMGNPVQAGEAAPSSPSPRYSCGGGGMCLWRARLA